jgi:4-hydroxybenzoate polyprenyltransferase
MRAVLLLVPLLGLLALAAYAAVSGWGAATLGITALLVGLMLWSRRHGYDRQDGDPD